MEISAHIRNRSNEHEVIVSTSGKAQPLAVRSKDRGQGSAINGGELLMAALATCYCNDLYREAERLGIEIAGCEVIATAHFDGIGLAAGALILCGESRITGVCGTAGASAVRNRPAGRSPQYAQGRMPGSAGRMA